MALGRAPHQVIIEQGVRAEAHDDEQVGNGLVTEVGALEHDRRLRGRSDKRPPLDIRRHTKRSRQLIVVQVRLSSDHAAVRDVATVNAVP